jgi:hypothetical protein
VYVYISLRILQMPENDGGWSEGKAEAIAAVAVVDVVESR